MSDGIGSWGDYPGAGAGGDLPGRDARAGFAGSGEKVPLQRWGPEENRDLDRRILQVGTATNPSASCPFEIRCPDVKCRSRIVLAIEQVTAPAIDPTAAAHTGVTGTNAATLWIAQRQRFLGSTFSNLMPPTRNLVGTAAAPLAIPTDTRLWGYELEFETAGEEIFGVLAVTGAAPATRAYFWHLITNFQSVEPVSVAEWKKMTERAGITRADLTTTGG